MALSDTYLESLWPETSDGGLPLAGVRVLDLSTLLPGPLAALTLSEAGASVLKVERPEGDEMRSYDPKFGPSSANYAMLNQGKNAVAANLKNNDDLRAVKRLMAMADIVIEQFRPGVAHRLGIGYEEAKKLKSDVIYCSITGYGQCGPLRDKAGHDLNYVAESGLLDVVRDKSGDPALPMTVMADIAGGSYPSVINILLALRHRDRMGSGCHLDISMAENLQTLAYGYLATRRAGGEWPQPGKEMLTGGSARYQIYRTGDNRHVAVAALEDRFWQNLCMLLEIAPEIGELDQFHPALHRCMSGVFRSQSSTYWRALFDGHDICCSVVNDFSEAEEMGLVSGSSANFVVANGARMQSLHLPLAQPFRSSDATAVFPSLKPLWGAFSKD